MIITLLSDFGAADYFVGSMKGAILSVDPAAVMVDLTHEIAPHDIAAAAFTLAAAYPAFPVGTIHLAVVDPGVGSARRPIAVRAGDHYFVGPDNGLFSLIYQSEPARRVFHLTNEKFFRHPVSNTFHGRDVFAPVAGALSHGVNLEELGVEIEDAVTWDHPRPLAEQDNLYAGAIIHIDRFGNCVTNFRADHWDPEGNVFLIEVADRSIIDLLASYADAKPAGEPFAIWGSAGYLEICVREGSAAESLGIRVGDIARLHGGGAAAG